MRGRICEALTTTAKRRLMKFLRRITTEGIQALSLIDRPREAHRNILTGTVQSTQLHGGQPPGGGIQSPISLVGRVEVWDAKTGVLLFDSGNTVLASGKKLVMDFLRKESVAGIQVLALVDATGEVFRKAPTSYIDTSDTQRVYSFFLSEVEPPTPPYTFTALKLVADNATTTLNTGTNYAQVAYARTKGKQSLLVNWTVGAI